MIRAVTLCLAFTACCTTAGLAIRSTHQDVVYGPYERNKLDLWLAESSEGRRYPLLVCIHCGGFRRGDKSKYSRDTEFLTAMRNAGISVAAINYRLSDGGVNPYRDIFCSAVDFALE